MKNEVKDYSLKSIRQDFKAAGVFYTDIALAEYLKSFFMQDVKEVYDPTCGNGNLLSVWGDDVKKYGQEINPEQAQVARERLTNAEIFTGDTMESPAFMDRKFKAIVANYPFSIKWNPDGKENDRRFSKLPCLPPPSKADYAFLAHIIHLLDDGGMAVVLNFPGVLYRGQREGKIRRWMIESGYIWRVERIEGGFFQDTKIDTALLVLVKDEWNGEFIFRDHETGEQVSIAIEDIVANDYNLSVSSYMMPQKEESPAIDPGQLNIKSRESFLKYLESRLEFDQMVAKLEGWDMDSFCMDIRKTVDNFQKRTK